VGEGTSTYIPMALALGLVAVLAGCLVIARLTRQRRVLIAKLLAVALCVGLLGWLWWALWGNHRPAAHSDRWLNVMTGSGGFATAAGIVVGGWLALQYGRRASVSIDASIYKTPLGLVMSTRPAVKAVGIFRVRFTDTGVRVSVEEVWIDDSGELQPGRIWEKGANWEQQYVDAGEELTTTVVFRLLDPTARVIGWTVFFRVSAPTRFVAPGASASWADQRFVARPDLPKD